MEAPIQVFFTSTIPLSMIVDKANAWLRKGKHPYKTVEFCRYDDFEVAATVKMRRNGYQIDIVNLQLLR